MATTPATLLPPVAVRRPIVIIGAGGIVRDAHLPAYRRAGFKVAGVYDSDLAKAKALAADFKLPVIYATLSEAVGAAPGGRPPVFDVAVPAHALPGVVSALPAGRAVLLQKPFGEDLPAARYLLKACQRRRLRAAVNFQLRFAPAVARARQMIAAGVIGELSDIEVRITTFTPWRLWKFLAAAPRVEILYHSIHYIDLIRSFAGDPRGVQALTLPDPQSPGLASTRSAILLDYGPVLRATVTTNHSHQFGSRHQESYVKWEGDKGAIKVGLGVLLDYPHGQPDTLEVCRLPKHGRPRWQKLPTGGNWFPDAFIGTMGGAMRLAADRPAPNLCTAADAFRTMAVVEAAYRASARGSTPIPSS